LASVERINSVLSAKDIDDSLAYGLAKELDGKELDDSNGVYENGSANKHFMSKLKSSSSCSNLAWSGDIHLKGLFVFMSRTPLYLSLYYISPFACFIYYYYIAYCSLAYVS
jgi:hypothetical protein